MTSLNSPFRGSLTVKDIEFIEERFDDLTSRLFPKGNARNHALMMELPEKIEEYIDMADHAEKGLKLGYGPELGQNLRDLLNRVNAHYHQRN
jgi:hypothetical protein